MIAMTIEIGAKGRNGFHFGSIQGQGQATDVESMSKRNASIQRLALCTAKSQYRKSLKVQEEDFLPQLAPRRRVLLLLILTAGS
jgi:hypothetical protein